MQNTQLDPPVYGDYPVYDLTASVSSAPGPSNAKEPTIMKTEEKEKKRRGSSAGEESQRVQLACYWCRSKRIRCSGERPICQACAKANVPCEWPSGRRKKRTRREMEEAKKAEEVKAEKPMSNDFVVDTSIPTGTPSFDGADFWSMPSTSSYVWPSGFTPEGLTFPVAEPEPPQFLQPPADMRLMNALESQTAYIEGDPQDGKDLELYYYRFSGSTAIHPGINRISLKLQRRPPTGLSPLASAPQTDDISPPHTPPDLFDPSGLPYPHVYEPLFDLFFSHMSQHFPSTSRKRMNERFESGTMSAFLANCICALAARYSENAKDSPPQACAPFIAKAQELIVPLLHLPTHDVCTGLLFLAWASFGQNSESGLWQYSGMAIRMAIDLGIHEVSEIYESPAHMVRTRLLFWSLFITDRVVAFATGRPASIPEDIIEIPLPEDVDFFPDPARNMPTSTIEAVEPVPFVQLVKLMINCGRISNVLNGRRGRVRTLVSTSEPQTEILAEMQTRLMQFYSSLPDAMKWTVENFKHQESRGHGGTFLSLHVWANAVLALVYHPELLKSPSGMETPLNRSMSRSINLSLASSRQICECMVFADLVSHSSYTSTPFIVQPLYVAAMALIHEMRSQASTDPASGTPQDMFLISIARQNFSALLKAVMLMETYWAGVTYVTNILEKRSGVTRSNPRTLKKTYISLPDKGLLRRFTTDREHPHNVAPPTETSLRDSIAKSEGSGPSPYWLADLLTGYTVENMSFAPADSLDLARLLQSSGANMGMGMGIGAMGDGRMNGNGANGMAANGMSGVSSGSGMRLQ